MNLDEAIAVLEEECVNPCSVLPEKVFLLLTRLTPMVNVDLLIKDDTGRTLLTWRDDIYHGSGWHIPGGIIRLKESYTERIAAVARLELGCEINHEESPTVINECIAKKKINRGHCISLLFQCKLTSPPTENLKYLGGKPQQGMFDFFNHAPKNLLKVHNMYRIFIDN